VCGGGGKFTREAQEEFLRTRNLSMSELDQAESFLFRDNPLVQVIAEVKSRIMRESEDQ
jgi:hypothetical protein